MTSKDIPPGLPSSLHELSTSDNSDNPWFLCPPLKGYTNAFIWDAVAGKILLGLKRRGFATGKYNGFGGKIEPGESPLEAAKRELQEEACITAPLKPCGILLFVTKDAPFAYYIHIFSATEFKGVPQETDEMSPYWFSLTQTYHPDHLTTERLEPLPPIPFEKMWQGDPHWFPYMLSDTYFYGRADFTRMVSENGEETWDMHRWWFGTPTESEGSITVVESNDRRA